MTDREDLYYEAANAYEDAADAAAARSPLGPRDTAPWRDGIRAVVDLVLDERPEPTDAEVLRAAAGIFDRGRPEPTVTAGNLRLSATRTDGGAA